MVVNLVTRIESLILRAEANVHNAVIPPVKVDGYQSCVDERRTTRAKSVEAESPIDKMDIS